MFGCDGLTNGSTGARAKVCWGSHLVGHLLKAATGMFHLWGSVPRGRLRHPFAFAKVQSCLLSILEPEPATKRYNETPSHQPSQMPVKTSCLLGQPTFPGDGTGLDGQFPI